MNTVPPEPTTAPTAPPPVATTGPPHTQNTGSAADAEALDGSVNKTVSHPLTAEEVRTALLQAKETHSLVVEWVRSLDYKVGPLLAADGALVGGCLALLGQQTLVLTPHPITHGLLAFTLLPLMYSLFKASSAISPTLRWVWDAPQESAHKPDAASPVVFHRKVLTGVRRSLRSNFTLAEQHLPGRVEDGHLSVFYFGHIALRGSEGYSKAAKAAYLQEEGLLDDLLHQTYINAQIALSKTSDIALSTRYLMIAILLLLLCGLIFVLGF